MLQRAASNAYSWWVAGHIRTKQSKWLEQSLQDMEEKVSAVMKLLSEDGDSFAKRAEMYYKRRPELLGFVEESFRAYRALAERYDHISKELQSANNTLASAFPDQFQYIMDDDDDLESPVMPRKGYLNSNAKTGVPSTPKHFPTKNIKAIMALASKTNNNINSQPAKKAGRRPGNKAVEALRSGFDKTTAVDEIDKLQKSILTKQTEKEFTKSSYESGVAKYMEIENEITEMQEKVSTLKEEFGVGKVIEDNEARNLMLEAALKSCQDTLAELKEKQAKSDADAKEERKRVANARDKIISLKRKFEYGSQSEPPPSEGGGADMFTKKESLARFDDGVNTTTSQAKEIEMLRDKMREHFEGDSSLSVSEMVEKIDELVNKVINMESAVSSQTAMINRMRVESDELQTNIQSLEGEKVSLMDGKNVLNDKLKAMELKLKGLQEMDHSVERNNNSLQMQFIEACSNLDVISHKLPDLKMQEETVEEKEDGPGKASTSSIPQQGEAKNLVVKPQDLEKVEESRGTSPPLEKAKQSENPKNDTQASEPEKAKQSENPENDTQASEPEKAKQSENPKNDAQASEPEKAKQLEKPKNDTQASEPEKAKQSEKPKNDTQASKQEKATQGEDGPNWQKEYILVLQNYKEVKKKLGEVENRNEDSLADLKELRYVIAEKDEEIRSLQLKLILLQRKLEEYMKMKETKEDNHTCPPQHDNNDVMMKLLQVEEQREMSPVEAKLRSDVDEILEENLNFWIKFSASFAEIQKFQSQVEDLQKDLAKVEENKQKSDVSSTMGQSLRSDSRAIYKHLKEIQAELTVWLEHSMTLKEELQRRFSQLCNIQEEIAKALNDGAIDDEMQFTSLQAAKLQGEVLNMQQENNRVADELQSSLDNVTNLQIDIERTITKLDQELGTYGSNTHSGPQCQQTGTKNQIPLHTFIFGAKPKKQKHSLFSCIHPVFHKKYQHLK